MKFQPDTLEGVNTIARHGPSGIVVAGRSYRGSVVVPWVGDIAAWAAGRLDDLQPAHFEQLLAYRPELVIFGSGPRLHFVAAAFYKSLVARGVGIETMDSAAACRTFNVLVSEKRAVLAALLFDDRDG